VYEAELELISAQGSRWVPYQNFHTGYKTTLMRSDELIKSIRLSRSTSGWKQHTRKVGTRKAQAISKVCFAGMARMNRDKIEEILLAYGSVAPVPLRVVRTEAILTGQRINSAAVESARTSVLSELGPIDDMRSTSDYRAQVAANLLEEFLHKLS